MEESEGERWEGDERTLAVTWLEETWSFADGTTIHQKVLGVDIMCREDPLVVFTNTVRREIYTSRLIHRNESESDAASTTTMSIDM